jgi:hypothetical protein
MDENRTRAAAASKRYGGVDDAALTKRTHPMPAHAVPGVHLEEGRLEIPSSLDEAKLICVLEFFSTFSATIGLQSVSISGLARELVGGGRGGGHQASQLASALAALKDIVCRWFGTDQVDPDGLAWDSWVVLRYLPGAALGPGLVPAGPEETDARSSRILRACKTPRQPSDLSKVVGRASGPSSSSSFWSLSVADRLEAVNLLVHDSLQCGPIVDVIENSIEDVSEAQVRHKTEMERVKKEISAEKERHKQRFIAELISSQQISNISAEKQQEILTTARQNASSAVSEENMSRLRWLKTSDFFKNCTGRTAAIGQDRTGLSYFSLNCAEIITGSSGGLVCMSEDSIRCFGEEDVRRVMAALDVSGEKEGALRMGLGFIVV